MSWKDILKTHCGGNREKMNTDNEKADKEKQIFEKLTGNQDRIDANKDGKISGEDFQLLRDRKKVKKANPEKMILDEIKQEGGALGMKNLKELEGISNLKETLDRLVKEGKIYIHGDGDIISIKKPSKGRGFTA
jgi:hypothetical protein|tara:strand:- start:487 stop:888 length:402 start_codon:yes stop_codon:yes gene_type:complete